MTAPATSGRRRVRGLSAGQVLAEFLRTGTLPEPSPALRAIIRGSVRPLMDDAGVLDLLDDVLCERDRPDAGARAELAGIVRGGWRP
jgi:hypothetical protein